VTYLDLIPDPGGYRDAAALLRRRATDLADFAERVDRTVESTVFEGPAAVALRATMSDQRSLVMQLCGELETCASSMAQAAASYEADLAADRGR
jgi:hypothetical protein